MQTFVEVPGIKFHENPFSGIRADTCGQTDTRKLVGAFRDLRNRPKNS